jgi:NAD(P)-dependent dehydrogenase (short-subunit alcohol dehydrogenase family)
MPRIAIVTGAGKPTGLGHALCRALAARGDTVWLTARDGDAASALAAAIGGPGQVRAAALDVTDPDSIAALERKVRDRDGALDLLINNAAGVAPWGETAAGADLDLARGVLGATLFGTWAVTQAFLPLLRASPAGRVVMVSSGAGSHGDPVFGLGTGNGMGTSYAVAKAALNALTVKLAREETAQTLRINAVCPGFTATFPGGAEMGARPVADGAASILWAADIGNDGPTGGFFRDGRPLPW